MKTSKLEEEALRQILAAGLPEPEREYQFLEDRKFRFDFAWLRHKVALEVEGGIWIGGGHSSGTGVERDMEKYNLAQINGWTVLRVSSNHIKRNEVAALVKQVL
jgi:very-short-patch-repair endonuclease